MNTKIVELDELNCCVCGTLYAIENTLREMRKKDGKSFTCPNGHVQSYTNGDANVIKELKEELGIAKGELESKRAELTRVKCELLKAKNQLENKGFFKRLF